MPTGSEQSWGKILGARRAWGLAGATALAAVVTFVIVSSGGADAGTGAAPPTSGDMVALRPLRPAPMAKSVPVSVDIPRIGAHSSLIALGLDAHHGIELPPVATPMQAGWYSYGPTPGEVGPAVVLGHVDGYHDKGIFFRLKELGPGDAVSIARKDGSTARFVVTRIEQVPKDVFPTTAVYGNTARPELRLITCGGGFERAARSYHDNIIVYATLS